MNDVSKCMGMHEDIKISIEGKISSHSMKESKRSHQKWVFGGQMHEVLSSILKRVF